MHHFFSKTKILFYKKEVNIVVCIKQVPDTGVSLKFSKGVLDETGLRWVLSPYDEFALEAGLNLKNQGGGQLFAVSLGPARVQEALLQALALGADEAFHLKTNQTLYDSFCVAQHLKEAIEKLPSVSLVLSGKTATDTNNFSVPQMLAQLLNFSFVTNVNRLEWVENQFRLQRECAHGGDEEIQAQCPLMLSVDKGLNQPRYPSLAGIMKAKKKPLHSVELQKREVALELISLSPPPPRKEPRLLTGSPDEQVQTLISLLKNEDKLL